MRVDFYNVSDDLKEATELVNNLFVHIEKLRQYPHNKSVRCFVRRKTMEIDKVYSRMTNKILKQKQDYLSDYS